MQLKQSDLTTHIADNIPEFNTTGEFEALDEIVGQDRAVDALHFGMNMKGAGYNIYVAGPPNIGKMTSVRSFVGNLAKTRETPPDWCYVHNFEDPYEPKALRLPAGDGRKLRADMERLVEQITTELPAAFESDEYSNEREQKLKQINTDREEISNEIQKKAERKGFLIQPTPMGVMLVPQRDGEPLKQEEVQNLSEEEQRRIQEQQEELQAEIRDVRKNMRRLQRRELEQERKLDQQVVINTVGGIIDDIREEYDSDERVEEFLKTVQQDILENIETFKKSHEASQHADQMPNPEVAQRLKAAQDRLLQHYRVNVVVDNADREGAPVVLELNPTYNNLIGTIEKEMRMGAVNTDFTLIKAGALLRADGGFLVLQTEDLVKNPASYEALKRALRAGELRIEELAAQFGLMTVKSLRPHPIPLNVKVILVGPPLFYQILHTYDHDFPQLFKVKADFDTRTEANNPNIRKFLRFTATFCREQDIRQLDRPAMRKLLEYAARISEHKERISTRFGDLADLIREANFWADGSRDGAPERTPDDARRNATDDAVHDTTGDATVGATHDTTNGVIGAGEVQRALDERIYRSNLMQEKIRELIEEGTLLIDTSGKSVAQLNGLSVVNLGDYEFGRPNRITATVSAGKEGVMDLEREARLGGPLHSKGVLILGGYLTNKYSRGHPLSLAARLVFEQSYSEIDGDSASQAELYAILSALSGYSLRQDVAVTGSVNQFGEVQAIGAVNQKIEGFFEVCLRVGLTGEQGVIIPGSNVKNLVLRQEVRDAAESGKFSVWAIDTIDEGIELLTGVSAGQRDGNGVYPESSVNGRVAAKFGEFERTLVQLRDTTRNEYGVHQSL